MILIKKMIRDIWNMKSQFVSIFLMCLLGILIYTGIEGVWYGMQLEKEDFFEESELAGVWVNGLNLTYKDRDDVDDLKGVDRSQLSAVYNCYLDKDSETSIRLIANSSNIISKPQVIKGDKYKTTEDGIWLDKDYADINDLSVGDYIKIYDGDYKIRVKIKGLVYSPEYISYTGTTTSIIPQHDLYTYGFVSLNTLKDINENIKYNQIKMVVDKGAKVDSLKKKIHALLGDKYLNCIRLDEYNQIYSYVNKIQQIKKMSLMFSVIFFLLAILTIRTTMKRVVQKQRTQIGILKALGVSNLSIKIHYAMYGLFVSALGAALGYVLAPKTITPVLMDLQKEFYSMPEWKAAYSYFSMGLAILMVLICTVTAWLSCTSIVKEVPAQSLRNQMVDSNKSTLIENISGLWSKLSFDWRWVLRDASKNKARTIIAIIGVLGSMMLLIASFGLQDSINNDNDRIYNEQYSYYEELKVDATMTEEDKAAIEKDLYGDYQWLMSFSSECKNSGKVSTQSVFVIDPGYYYNIQNTDGKIIDLPEDGIILSQVVADELNASVNEFVNILYNGSEIRLKVMGIEPVNSPQGVYISKKYWEDMGLTFSVNTLLAGHNQNLKDIEKKDFVKEIVKKSVQANQADEIINSVHGVIVLLIAAAVMLSVVILYNLALLNFAEKYREYATLRVLGAYNREIRGVIYKGSVLNVFVGWIVGTVVGWYFLRLYVHTISTNTTIYSPYIKVSSYLLATGIALGCSVLVNIMVAKKAVAIDMVESLKSVE